MRRLVVPAGALLVWAAHVALLRWMAGADEVAALLSGGGASEVTLVGAAAFVGLRLAVGLVLPGALLAWAGALVVDGIAARRAQADSSGRDTSSARASGSVA